MAVEYRLFLACAALLFSFTAAAIALADGAVADQRMQEKKAVELKQIGKQLHDQCLKKKEVNVCERAIAKLGESYDLRPSGKVRRWSGHCHLTLGHRRTAWKYFRAGEEKLLASVSDDGVVSSEEAEELRIVKEERQDLENLTLKVDTSLPWLAVWVDGELIPLRDLGSPMAVDDGPHAISAEAINRFDFQTNVFLASPNSMTVQIELKIPPPEPAHLVSVSNSATPSEGAVPAPIARATHTSASETLPSTSPRASTARPPFSPPPIEVPHPAVSAPWPEVTERYTPPFQWPSLSGSRAAKGLGIGLLSAGGGAIILGSLLGLEVLQTADSLREDRTMCPRNKCFAAGRAALDGANEEANIATGLLLGGLAGVAAGGVFLGLFRSQRGDRAGTPLQSLGLVATRGSLGLGVQGSF